MAQDRRPSAGFFRGGLPYNRFGRGPRTLVVVQGLTFENAPLHGISARFSTRIHAFLGDAYTGYIVNRRPGLPRGFSMGDMAADYATTIREEWGGPVDVIGISTGGSIAQHLAADHPDVVRRLVIHSGAHTLSQRGRALQAEVAWHAARGDWRGAWAPLIRVVQPQNALGRALVGPFTFLAALGAPRDPSDLIVTVEAEDAHAFRDHLGEIGAPTLVIAGDADPFYTPDLFRETAEGIPGARLVLFTGMGHPASGPRFRRAVLDFLAEERADRPMTGPEDETGA
jgi:pimeloyl-ACP methyl ester carboxylesterase